MSWRSVRIRLTVLVVVVAAVAMVLAATAGVSRIRDSLVDDVLEKTAEESSLFGGVLFDPGLDDGFEFFEDDLQSFALELEDLVGDLDRIGALDPLLARTGVERSDGLAVLHSFGVVAIVGIDGAETEILDLPPAEIGVPLAWDFNLSDLVFSGLDSDFDDAFFEADSTGFFDEQSFDELLDERLAERGAAMEIATAVVSVDGVEFVVVADVAAVSRSVDRIRSVLWTTMPVLVVLAGVLTWFLTGRALSPVRRMSRQVAVISGGTLHERVQVPATGDEIQELGATMNAMLDRLENDDRRLRRFVSDASHELRSPVAVLRSEAEVALRAPESTNATELAEGVLDESMRLERIVSDLLVLARGDEARGPARFLTIDLDDIVLVEAGRRRRVPIDTSSVSAGQVKGTQDGCTRVLVHLLDNAARHAESEVRVGLRTEAEAVILWVDDDGPGIPVADRDLVFERFTRLEAARTRDTGGAGLGLAVVAATVASMDATVAISDSPTGGARVIVRFGRLGIDPS